LNKHFASVFSIDNGTTPKVNDLQGPPIGAITFTKNGILKLLKDLIQPTPVAQMVCQPECSDALVLLFTASWKYKGGNKNRSKAENYRPLENLQNHGTVKSCNILIKHTYFLICSMAFKNTDHARHNSYKLFMFLLKPSMTKSKLILYFWTSVKSLIRLAIGSCFTN